MKTNKTYTFKKLESFLNGDENWDKCLIVKNIEQKITAVMHVFLGNFDEAYKSGDGILFYSDGEAHSANPDDKFLLIQIITLPKC